MRIANSAHLLGSVLTLISAILTFLIAITFLSGGHDVAISTDGGSSLVGGHAIRITGIFAILISILVFVLAIVTLIIRNNPTFFIAIIICSVILLIMAAVTIFSTLWIAALIGVFGGIFGLLGINRRNRLQNIN